MADIQRRASPLFLGGLLLMAVPLSSAGAQTGDAQARLVEELRLDATAHDLSVVSRLYVGPQGEIVLPLQQDMRIRVYDSMGSRIAMVGQRGNGPGEFQRFGTAGWMADTFWISDPAQRRVTYLGPDWTIGHTRRIPLPTLIEDTRVAATEVFNFSPVALYTDGSILGSVNYFVFHEGRRTQGTPGMALMEATGGARLITPLLPSHDDPRWSVTVDIFRARIPFTTVPQSAFSPNGGHFARLFAEATSGEGGTLTVSLFTAEGDTVFVRSYPFRAPPVSRAAADSALAQYANPRREGPPDLGVRLQALLRQRMPQVDSRFHGFRLGLDDTIWIELPRISNGRHALVLSSRGESLGTVALPPRSRIEQASATQVWMVEEDEYGLTSVVRYRVEGLRCVSPGCL